MLASIINPVVRRKIHGTRKTPFCVLIAYVVRSCAILTVQIREKPYYSKKEKKVGIAMVLDKKQFTDHGRCSQKFLVKWNNKAHYENRWISERRLLLHNPAKLNNFLAKDEGDKELNLDLLFFWLQPERIIVQKGYGRAVCL